MRSWRAYILSMVSALVVATWPATGFCQAAGEDSSTGPDVVVSNLGSVNSWGYENTLTGYITGMSFETVSCNWGDTPLQWQSLMDGSTQHPVIRQAMYRLKDHKFEQIGIAWVKHGFFAVNGSQCGLTCTAPPDHGGSALYPGCSDPYDAGLNGGRTYLGPSWQINAFTGTFSLPVVHPSSIGQNGRLQVHNVDLDAALNPGALYYIEGFYVAADDAGAGNADNNASYRRVNVVSAPSNPDDSCQGTDPNRFCTFITDSTHVTLPAIRAWKVADPSVVETNVRVPGEGLFILAAKARDLGTGLYRYEYALHNLNSDRSGRTLTIPVAVGAPVSNLGFHDVEYHSGEPFDNTDWEISVLPGKIIWSGEDYSVNPNANALRWGTLYNFRFDTSAPPAPTTITLDLFKPGAPSKVSISTIGPLVGFIDCNENGVADACDVSCSGVGCSPPCGTATDCNNNGVPDECEEDCNGNGIADTCDLIPIGDSPDCNGNTVPDECEEDCNGDGFPDNCVLVPDTDGDGMNDCVDECPETTPPAGCAPPNLVCCLYSSGLSISGYSYYHCLSDRGTPLCDPEGTGSCFSDPPLCPTSFCRGGCMVGDDDGDGDFDLADFGGLSRCYSGMEWEPGFEEPDAGCLLRFDYDESGSVDLGDVEQFRRLMAGPAE